MFGFNRNDVKLILNFFKITMRDKYIASGLGSVWAVLNPLLMMSIYAFVFTFVFHARLPGANGTLAYTTWLISGYGPWLAITEALMAATTSIVASAGIVKNMAFKTEILPIAFSLTAIVPLCVSLVFLAILLTIDGNFLSWHAVFIVPIVLLQFLFVIALGFFLSAITVFVRDISIVLPNILMMLLFATPIFYPIEIIPHFMRIIAYANPFYIIAESYRETLIQHTLPNLLGLVYVFVFSMVLIHGGLIVFRRVKGYFASLL